MVWVANELHIDSGVSRRVLQAPRDVPIAYENKAGTHLICWFSYSSNTFHSKYLQIKHYESISIIVQIWDLFTLSIFIEVLIGWWKSQTNTHTHIYASIWLEDSFGSFLGWDRNSASGEEIPVSGTTSKSTALAF